MEGVSVRHKSIINVVSATATQILVPFYGSNGFMANPTPLALLIGRAGDGNHLWCAIR